MRKTDRLVRVKKVKWKKIKDEKKTTCEETSLKEV